MRANAAAWAIALSMGAWSMGTLALSRGALAAPFMIVGNDEKLTWDDHGAPVLHPGGNDTVMLIDLADREKPRVAATLKVENSVVGPPVNLAISPKGDIALVADSIAVTESGGKLKQGPSDKLFVIDLRANPPHVSQTVTLGQQPSGLSFNARGDMALVANRLGKSVSVLKIADGKVSVAGTVPLGESVSTVEFTPDGTHALAVESVANRVDLLNVSGDQVADAKVYFPTYLFPYNAVVTPDGRLGITADNGNNGNSDGNVDAISVIDLKAGHPHVIDHIAVPDAPEGIAVSPLGNLVAVASVQGSNHKGIWYHHKNGVVTILRIDGAKLTPVRQIEVGSTPEAMGFTPDGGYLYVGNYLGKDFSILRVVNGNDVKDTGKRFAIDGHPASARMSAR